MKVYVSVDIEGVAGITHWDEADKRHPDYAEFREAMIGEAVAAVEGALAAGATEVWVKDAHDSGRNLVATALPAGVRLLRAWSGHPLCMVEGLDGSFDAVVMIGYHARAGSEANALAHTMEPRLTRIAINGVPVSEFTIHALASSMLGVPTVFVSGDAGLMEEVAAANPAIERCPVKQGLGAATISMTPAEATAAIRSGVARALHGDRAAMLLALPPAFDVDVTYGDPASAYRMQWYPGASHVGDRTVRFTTPDYFEVLRFLRFTT